MRYSGIATLLCWWRLVGGEAATADPPAATTSDRPPGAPDDHRPWRQPREVHRAHVGQLVERGDAALVPLETAGRPPVTSRLSSETLSTPCGSLRTTSSTWSSWYQRSTLGSLAAYSARFGLSAVTQITLPPCW